MIGFPGIVRLGSRGSQLALAQTRLVQAALLERRPDLSVEVVIIATAGDRSAERDAPIDRGKGDFVREIEAALLGRRIEAAVHSLKDVPVNLPEGLALAACLPRADPRDALVSEGGLSLDALPAGARVGTSSPRRRALISRRRPDLDVVAMRGNVPTRLRKLHEGEADALVLACAGLDRLGLRDEHVVPLPFEEFCPAPGQGIVAVETKEGRPAEGWAALGDSDAGRAALCERAVVRAMGADCHTPLGAHARMEGGRLVARAVWLSSDGMREYALTRAGEPEAAEAIGRDLGEALLSEVS